MTVANIKKYCRLSSEATEILKFAITRFGLSARAYFKIIKVAQTIADISRRDIIEKIDISEAIQFRSKEN